MTGLPLADPAAGRGVDAPRVEVIVVTWNSAKVLPGLLESLPDGLSGLRWHLTIADNASADETVAVARTGVPECGIVQTGRNAGYSAAFNAALSQVDSYDAVLILNPDIRLTPGSVARLYEGLRDSGGIGITVPTICDERGHLAHSLRRAPTLGRAVGQAVLGNRANRYPALGETVLDPAAYEAPTTVDWATGAVMLMSAECLAACGEWDESFFLYSEETDYALRAKDSGFRTQLVPEARAVHLGGESRVSPPLWALLTVNRVRLYRKRHGPVTSAGYWCAVFLGEAVRAALGHPRSRRAVAALVHPGGRWMASPTDHRRA